jgi:nicotinamidase/pyrazinamidase
MTSGVRNERLENRMATTSLLVVDFQNDFVNGSLPVPGAEKIIPAVNNWIRSFDAFGRPVFFSQDWHPQDSTHFQEWPRHCVMDTKGAQIHDGLYLPPKSPVYRVRKGMGINDPGYSAMSGRALNVVDPVSRSFDFLDVLNDTSTAALFICGIATDYCVRETVLDAIGEGYEVVLLTDACAAVTDAGGRDAIAEMHEAGAKVATASGLLMPGSRN